MQAMIAMIFATLQGWSIRIFKNRRMPSSSHHTLMHGMNHHQFKHIVRALRCACICYIWSNPDNDVQPDLSFECCSCPGGRQPFACNAVWQQAAHVSFNPLCELKCRRRIERWPSHLKAESSQEDGQAAAAMLCSRQSHVVAEQVLLSRDSSTSSSKAFDSHEHRPQAEQLSWPKSQEYRSSHWVQPFLLQLQSHTIW